MSWVPIFQISLGILLFKAPVRTAQLFYAKDNLASLAHNPKLSHNPLPTKETCFKI